MFDSMKARPSFTGENTSRKPKKEDDEIARIKALLFSDDEPKEESEEDKIVKKLQEELFKSKPKENTLKDWMTRRKNKLF